MPVPKPTAPAGCARRGAAAAWLPGLSGVGRWRVRRPAVEVWVLSAPATALAAKKSANASGFLCFRWGKSASRLVARRGAASGKGWPLCCVVVAAATCAPLVSGCFLLPRIGLLVEENARPRATWEWPVGRGYLAALAASSGVADSEERPAVALWAVVAGGIVIAAIG